MLRLGSATIVPRKERVKQSSRGPWMKEQSSQPAGKILAGWFFSSKTMPKDMIRIGEYCSENHE